MFSIAKTISWMNEREELKGTRNLRHYVTDFDKVFEKSQWEDFEMKMIKHWDNLGRIFDPSRFLSKDCEDPIRASSQGQTVSECIEYIMG